MNQDIKKAGTSADLHREAFSEKQDHPSIRTDGERDHYKVAGQAHRDCMARMVAAEKTHKVRGYHWKVYSAVMAIVPSYSRTTDIKMSVGLVAKTADVHPKKAAAGLRDLHDFGVWTWISTNTRKADSILSLEAPDSERTNRREGTTVVPSTGNHCSSTTEKHGPKALLTVGPSDKQAIPEVAAKAAHPTGLESSTATSEKNREANALGTTVVPSGMFTAEPKTKPETLHEIFVESFIEHPCVHEGHLLTTHDGRKLLAVWRGAATDELFRTIMDAHRGKWPIDLQIFRGHVGRARPTLLEA